MSKQFSITLILFTLIALITLSGSKLVNDVSASVADGTASVYLEPSEGNYSVEDEIISNIYFNTASSSISGIAVRLFYPYSGTSPEVTVSAIDINPDFATSGDWVCPTKNSSQQGGNVVIDIACANTSATGFQPTSDTLLSTIKLKVNSIPATNPLVVRFVPDFSIITLKSNGTDILAIPTIFASFTITSNQFVHKTCQISLAPSSISLPAGQSVKLTASVTGRKATSVSFSTNHEDLALLNPIKDRKNPFSTILYVSDSTENEIAIIYAKAYLGKNVICETTGYLRKLVY